MGHIFLALNHQHGLIWLISIGFVYSVQGWNDNRWVMCTVIHISVLSLKLQEAFAPRKLLQIIVNVCLYACAHVCKLLKELLSFWCQLCWDFLYLGIFACIDFFSALACLWPTVREVYICSTIRLQIDFLLFVSSVPEMPVKCPI